jgi:glycosyltransferase involved in cell wall biosynthesis
MNSPSISVIIITRNEANNLPDCLRSVAFCNEIILVDNDSEDETRAIAQAHGATVISSQHWPGFGLQKQRALDAAHGDWVLSLDADERVTAELASQIIAATQASDVDGYWINRKSQFLGKWMRHGGWYPDRLLRLARRSKAKFDPTPIHEKMLVTGKTATLSAPILHFSYRSIEDVLTKQKNYSLAGAAKKRGAGASANLLTALGLGIWTFTRAYLFRLGFLDGSQGFVAAVTKSQETFWKYLAVAWPGDRSR